MDSVSVKAHALYSASALVCATWMGVKPKLFAFSTKITKKRDFNDGPSPMIPTLHAWISVTDPSNNHGRFARKRGELFKF